MGNPEGSKQGDPAGIQEKDVTWGLFLSYLRNTYVIGVLYLHHQLHVSDDATQWNHEILKSTSTILKVL